VVSGHPVPIYVTDCRVEWGWAKRNTFERGIIRKYQPELDGSDHGLESITAILTRASGELPTLEIQALLEYDTRGRTLLLAARGAVRAIEIKDAVQRGRWRELPYLPLDHIASVETDQGEIEVPVDHDSEDAMRDALRAVAAAMTGEPDEFVAEVGPRRFLVRLAPGAVEVLPLISWPSTDEPRHAAVIEALLAADKAALFPEVVPTRDRAVDPSAKLEVSIYLPGTLFDDLQGEAARLDRSLSWMVQRAWIEARDRIRGASRDVLAPQLLAFDGAPVTQSLYVPASMLVEIEEEAARLDSSKSWLVRLAWSLARAVIAALPDAPT
jgi:uncharacterized small protein (TIGR04563 family)